MKSLGRIAIVILLCAIALGYLYQHECSLRLTKQLSRLQTEKQLLLEDLDSINVDIAQLTSFNRLDSLWDADEPSAPLANPVRAEATAEPTQVAVVR